MLYKCRRLKATIAPRPRYIPVRQVSQPYPVVVFRQQRQATMSCQSFFSPLNLESKHRLSYHVLTLSVKGFESCLFLYTRFLCGRQGLSFLTSIFYLCFRAHFENDVA